MTRRRPAGLVLLALAAAACGPARPQRVVIGVGLTENTNGGLRLAVAELNRAGGLDGVRIEFAGLEAAHAGTLYDPKAILGQAATFTAIPDLIAVIGHNDSATTLSAAPTYNRAGIPHLVTIATSPVIANIGPWTYRLCLSDAFQGPLLAEYAVSTWGKRRIALFYVNDDYGRGLAQAFEARARDLGAVTVRSVIHHNALQEGDLEAIRGAVAEMQDTRPDLVVLFQRPAAATATVKILRGAGLATDILGGDNLSQRTFLDTLPGLSDGIRVSQLMDLDEAAPRTARFLAACRSQGIVPDYSQAYAYDAVYLLRDAVARGGYTRAGVKAYLDSLITGKIRIEGVTGSYTLAPDHDARRPLYVAEVRGGSLATVATLPIR